MISTSFNGVPPGLMLDILRQFAGFETIFPPMQPVMGALENTVSTTMTAVISHCPLQDIFGIIILDAPGTIS